MSRLAKVLFFLMIGILLCLPIRPLQAQGRLAVTGFEELMSYESYLRQHSEAGAQLGEADLLVLGKNFVATDMEGELVYVPEKDDYAVVTEDWGYMAWLVNVPRAGFYNLAIEYFPVPGRGISMERAIEINGAVPFEGAKYLVFSRVWGDAEPIRMDNQGNELRPLQREFPMWQTKLASDSMGDYAEPYLFYLEEGLNTITLRSRREPMQIYSLRLYQADPSPSYAEVVAYYKEQNYKPAQNVLVKLQERDSSYRSDSTISPLFDQGDPTMEPYHPALIRLNMIGRDSWSQTGQWVRWDFEVPQDGLYQIAIKGKQNQIRGWYSNRRIYIDDEVPFQELNAVRFPYSSNYELNVLGPEGGEEPYLVYLTKGTHTLTMEVVLGDLVDIIRTVESSVYELNSLYRQIVMITSPTPDPMRTYELPKRIPSLIETMQRQEKIVGELADQLEEYTGQKGGATVLLRDLARQLGTLSASPDTIPTRLAKFRDNLGSLGTWLLSVRKQPLAIDYVIISSPDQDMPLAQATPRERLQHESRAFAASYTHNYQLVGDVYEGETEPLKVWIGWGRDQAQILKRLIENNFTPQTGIPVNLELVSMGVLLPATLAGKGPDVAMGVPAAQPINFAFRGGVVDLAKLESFDAVVDRFMPSAIVPFQFRDSVYALPDQQSFLMLFYRSDIVHELGLQVPNTWEEVFDIIPVLQKRNMEFGLPYSVPAKAASGAIGDVSGTIGSLSSSGGVLTLLSFLYQQGEELFVEDGIATNLDHETSVAAFSQWTELYELYKLPLDYNAINRFRMGEMPFLIANYGLYNELQVFAPELRGKWGFTLVPGTEQADGSINRSTPAGSAQTGSIIMEASNKVDEAWEFLKWWTSTEVQMEFGRQIESVLGPAGRYATANVEALAGLPWSVEEYDKLITQWRWTKGVPEVPGGYMIGRYLDNAFRQVVYNNKPARDTLADYNRLINEEITRKRIEFELPVALEELEPQDRRLYWVTD